MEAQKLEPEFKAKWIAALRSGEYKQGSGELYNHSSDTFCCLGVACRVAGLTKDQIPDVEFIGNAYYDAQEERKVFNPAGIPEILVGCNNESVPVILSHMNDGAGDWHKNPKSFLEIADWIEANL